MSEIYQPAEDTHLMQKELENFVQKNKVDSILEIGCGSGHNLQTAKKIGIKNILGTDINPDAVNHCKKIGFNCIKSNLFSKIKGKFDLIIFNPPYLPEDSNEPKSSRLATTGGKKGSELINLFLKEARKFLKRGGGVLLLTSSLTKGINFGKFSHKIIAKKKLFFEELYIHKLWEKNLKTKTEEK